MKMKVVFSTLFMSFLACSYLIWWHHHGVYTGIYGDLFLTDQLAIACMILLIIFSVWAVWQFRKEKQVKWILVFSGLTICYLLNIQHGWSVQTTNSCDLSVCETVTLYPDGHFVYRRADQVETTVQRGTYEEQEDAVILPLRNRKLKIKKKD